MGKKVGNRYHYSGAIHVHTTESDGTKPIEEVIAIGQRAGLDFMMITDHMGLATREAGQEGLYGAMLVVIGYEHNDTDDNNHYLVFNSPRVYPPDMAAKDYVEAARADGAFGLIAHPFEHRSREGRHPPFPWLEWGTDRFDGLEIWNQMSEWMEKLTRFNKIAMAFSPRKSMVGPTDETLAFWDRISRLRKYVGVAGVDAHAFPIKLGPLTVEIFPYKVHFRCLRTHIILDEPLADDFAVAREQLYDALAACRVFNSNMRWGKANEFEFRAENGTETAVCGGSLASPDGARLKIKLPSRATIKLVADGAVVVETTSDALDYVVTRAGLYRVEAWKGKRGWIFSNHIRIGTGGSND